MDRVKRGCVPVRRDRRERGFLTLRAAAAPEIIWQSAGAWELSYRYADPEREVQYLAVFSLGVTAQDIYGPALVAVAVVVRGLARPLALRAAARVSAPSAAAAGRPAAAEPVPVKSAPRLAG